MAAAHHVVDRCVDRIARREIECEASGCLGGAPATGARQADESTGIVGGER
jgi:hypothetical protein